MKRKVTFLFSLLFSFGSLNAQMQSEYEQAKVYLNSNQMQLAKTTIDQHLKEDPFNYDWMLLYVLALAKNTEYDSAALIIQKMENNWPGNQELEMTSTRISYWSGKYSEAISEIEKFDLSQNPEFFQMKINCFMQLGENEKALNTLESNKEMVAQSKNLENQHRDLKRKLSKNSLEVNYTYAELIELNTNWQFVTLGYSRKLSFGKISPNVSYGNMDGQQGLRFDIDFYPVFTKKAYAYVNAGYSNNLIFPNWKLAGEVYHTLPFHTEISGGVYYYKTPDSKIYNYTIGITGYAGRYVLGYKLYFSDYQGNLSPAHLLKITRNFKSGEFQLLLMKGKIPVALTTINEAQNLNTKMISLGYDWNVSASGKLKVSAAYFNEKISELNKRNRVNISVGYTHNF